MFSFGRRRKRMCNPYMSKVPKISRNPFKVITVDEAVEAIVNQQIIDLFLLDVRTKHEYQVAHIKGAMNIDVNYLNANKYLLPANKNARILIYCNSGDKAVKAAYLLTYMGYTNISIWEGGSINSMIPKKLVIS